MKVINELNQQITLSSTKTASWLLMQGVQLRKQKQKRKARHWTDAYILYQFYCTTASMQGTATINANDYYVKHGLGWGSDRLTPAKRILMAKRYGRIIQKKKARDANGKITKHYIKIRGVFTNRDAITPETHTMDTTSHGNQPTNTVLSNSNASESNQISAHAENKHAFKRVNTIGFGRSSRSHISHQWQDHALRLANGLDIEEPSRSWFKFFRDKHRMGKSGLLDAAFRAMVDMPVKPKNPERYFYKVFRNRSSSPP